MGYISGTARGQSILFPQTLDDYLDAESEVRVIAAFIEHLAFEQMEFVRGEPAETGRPGYDPRVLLGIYIWGHLNGVRSSRRLEKECGRNVELMWLTGRLQPDFKTLCRFRRENGKAIKNVLAQFRLWCLEANLFGKELVAIDGSKFKAVNSTSRNLTQKKLAKLIERERESAARYMAELEAADQAEDEEPERKLTVEELKKKIATIGDYLKEQEEVQREMEERGEKQRSLTDPEARLMKSANGMEVGYNVQLAVDSKHKLIASVEVTNEVNDQQLLAQMGQQAKADLGVEQLKVVADGGYFGYQEIKACEEKKITVYVPLPEELGRAKRRGLFPREQFKYDEHKDVYICPHGAELTVFSRPKKKARRSKEYQVYTTNQCVNCPLRAQCTTSKYGRRIKRWAHEAVIARLRERLRSHPAMLKRRKGLAEHPFGTIKVGMNHARLLMRGLSHVATEMRLTVLSYNFKRVMSILGAGTMLEKLHPRAI